MALLEVKQLSKSFGGIHAVNDCTFSVQEGSVTALIGPNGAGKTTAFNLITGLLKPDSGQILFEDQEISNLQPHRITRKGVSRTFQISRDLGEMTVLENLIVQAPTRGLRDLFYSSILHDEEERARELTEADILRGRASSRVRRDSWQYIKKNPWKDRRPP